MHNADFLGSCISLENKHTDMDNPEMEELQDLGHEVIVL